MNHQNKIILFLSLPLTALVTYISLVGLLTPNFYSLEKLNWQTQSMGQDMIDLFLIVPSLFITSVLAYRNNKTAKMIWGGVVLYLTYTFVLYCFDLHFNKLFVLYCFSLGLSFYSIVNILLTSYKENNERFEKSFMTRFIGIYFIIIAALFYFLWLSEIIPSIIQNTILKSVTDAGLFTNGVHIIDLAIILPAIFITGIFLLKRISLGLILTPIILTFFILMDLSIGILVVLMNSKGVGGDLMISIIMGLLALVSLFFLIWYFRCIETKTNIQQYTV